ncbi:biotin--[acetyl-CoA-carboxylase] ligase [Sphingomonas sp.]|uniref:biotin--[acetyl-CoA-carboxylase] ligase n=1 Tax=Sphingomonas sp. TaxID=28214 RepID=UPI0025F18A81|nr:biotin--[acetyl-CoA-carboxylase] ligase [Sphingomonas sp.]
MVERRCRSAILTIIHVAQTGSTNADMLDLARNGAVTEGDWLHADQQTSGRGRLGRDWISPPGNVHASSLVTLRAGDPAAPTLALVAALAVFDTLKLWAPAQPLVIKWPNDLLVDGAKISGILLESIGSAIVVGVGINLVPLAADPGRPATSLATLGIAPPDAATMVAALAEILADWLARWRGEGLAAIRAVWLARAHPTGTALSATTADGDRVEGLFDGLTDGCALRLRLADGATRVIHAGDVFLI